MSDLDTAYTAYAADPTPDNLSSVVEYLTPTIDYSLRSINASNDKLLRSKARLFAAEAVQKYNPNAGSSLSTWTSNQLMQLRRYKREVNQPIKVPERTQLDAYALARAEQEFIDKNEREPDLQELSDYAKIPIKKIEKIRRTFKRMPGSEGSGDFNAFSETDYSQEALEYIYNEEDAIGRKIIEMKTGFGGKYDPMQPKDIAIKLGLTPSQLSRRSAKLSLRLQEIEQALLSL